MASCLISRRTFICLCYNVSEWSSRQGLIDNVNIFNRISDQMVHRRNITNSMCDFMVCGDINARSSNFADYVEDDTAEHIHVLPDDYLVDTPLMRASEDKGFTRYGSQLLDFCKETGLRIANGRVGKDKGIEKYTFVGSTGKSVVDFIMVSQCFFPYFNNFEVDDPNILSDHCMIHFSFFLNENDSSVVGNTSSDDALKYKYVWNSNELETYQSVLQSNEIQSALNNLQSQIGNIESIDDLNSNVNGFQEMMESVCNPLFKKNIYKLNARNDLTYNETNQPWFNEKCKQKRILFYRNPYRYLEF